MLRGFLVSLLLSFPLFAQVGDLRVTFPADARMTEPYYTFNADVSWTGDEPARDLVIEIDVPGEISAVHPRTPHMKCTQKSPVRCTFPLLLKDESFSEVGVSVRLEQPGRYVARATVSTSTPEGPVDNNTATHVVEQAGLPSIRPSLITETETLDPSGTGSARLGIQNDGAPATNVVVRLKVEDGGAILSAVPTRWASYDPTAECTIAGGEALCRIGRLERRGFELVQVTYRAPDRREGGRVVVTAALELDEEDFAPENNTSRMEVILRRLFLVTSAEDSGSGTLRQAIHDTREQCQAVACTIAFEGLSAIQLRTPLPAVRGVVRIDGGEARVAIDGSSLTVGDGVVYEGGCQFDVRNLEVRNFPGHGIETRVWSVATVPCYPFGGWGVYVHRSVLSGNERGIVIKGDDVSLRENVIAHNRRAGVFIDGSYYSGIYNNVIVDNGATGIFLNTLNETRFGGIPPGADIVENIVHGNGEWGIARTRNTAIVQMRRNSMAGNTLYGYDVGLDLSSPNRADASARDIPNKPVLESATYDPATHTTVIRGKPGGFGFLIDWYASSSLSRFGYPEGETYLGANNPIAGGIELRVPGDLRGQWITATSSHGYTLYWLRDELTAEDLPRSNVYRGPSGTDTSELSDAIQVR
jgi:hypothetical protein